VTVQVTELKRINTMNKQCSGYWTINMKHCILITKTRKAAVLEHTVLFILLNQSKEVFLHSLRPSNSKHRLLDTKLLAFGSFIYYLVYALFVQTLHACLVVI